MDEIDSILNEAMLNVVLDAADSHTPDFEGATNALSVITQVIERAKEADVFSDEEHEENVVAFSMIVALLLKAYPQFVDHLKQCVAESPNAE